jgi:hypothetical protein
MKTLTAIATLVVAGLFCTASAQAVTKLQPDEPEKFTVTPKQDVEFSLDLKAGDVCNITTDAPEELPMFLQLADPKGKVLVKDGEVDRGWVFVPEATGSYTLAFKWYEETDKDEAAKVAGKQITVRYSGKFKLPTNATTKAVRTVNGYQAKIADEPNDGGSSYLVVSKAGKIRAIMREEKEMTGGLFFSDDAKASADMGSPRTTTMYRTTPDKTGDGTPDIAVEYYTGGAHCCFEITFFELGQTVRQLPTIDTDNDRLTPVAKLPNGGLRFEAAEQAFCYWTINYAQSPQPMIIWEFKNEELRPRWDLMRKPAPTLAALKRMAATAKAKINLNPYTSPDDNFNDFQEPFWDEMLKLIYTGHEDLAWQYFDLVWPAKKTGKEKFLADFKEQLSKSVYGQRSMS